MKKISILMALTLTISIIVSISLAELAASLWLTKGSTASVCPNWDIGSFANSRGFSLENAFYEPLSAIKHCQPEYNYTYHIDKNGFRNSSFYGVSPTILAIGDSFTFGFGVKDEETFPAIIGAYNAGMWGNPFDVQYKAFQRDVNLVLPNIVVWGIYPPHIITMMPGEWSKNIPGNKILFTTDSIFLRDILASTYFQKLGNSSIVKLFFKSANIKEILFDGTDVILKRDGYQTKEIILFDKNISTTQYSNSERDIVNLGKDRDAILLQMQEYFKGAKQIADKNKIKILFFIIPSRLNLRLHDGTENIPNYKNASIDPALPATLVTNSIVNAGFTKEDVLDLGTLPQFQSGGWKKFYFNIDAHWVPAGHKLVAEALSEKLSLPHAVLSK